MSKAMFDTSRHHSSARKAAFAALTDAVNSDSPAKSVTGTHLGLEVTFLDKVNGWEVTVKGVESLPALEIVYTGNESSNGDFTDLYERDGTPGSLDVLTSSDFHSRIMAVLPKRITMSEGRLVLTKTYVLYTAEAKRIEDAIALGGDLLIAAQRTSKSHTRQQTSGAPYRQESLAVVGSNESELAAFRSRQRARRAIRFSHVLLTLALVFVWPVGLFVWAKRRHRRS